MKPFYFLCVFTVGAVLQAKSQAFSTVALENIQDHKMVCFTVAREVNVKCYRIEASNDSLNFDFLGMIRPSANSMLAKSYGYEVYNPVYKYYRVSRIGMNAKTDYSTLIAVQKQSLEEIQSQNVNGQPTIVNKKQSIR